ncbi:MAG: RidA family protein [Acidobacteria bacterium]|nr:RidA family protein [Acidobacteriota bacterium]
MMFAHAVLMLCTTVVSAFGQGVVMETADVRFAVYTPELKGSLMEQATKLRTKVKGRVQRIRAFVPLEAETSLLNIVLKAPALSVVRVAGLPLKGQKISVEVVTDDGRNPDGLVFVSGQGVSQNAVVANVKPLVTTALDNIDKALKGVSLAPADAVSVTCFVSSLGDGEDVAALATSRYPNAAYNQVQIPMPYGRALVECEAVARGKTAVGFVYPEGLTKSPNFTQVVGISSKKMMWSGLHVAKGCTEAGVRKMFEELSATVKKKGGALTDAAFSHVYPTSQTGIDLSRKVRLDFLNKAQMPASTLIPFSGFNEADACTGVEVALPVR